MESGELQTTIGDEYPTDRNPAFREQMGKGRPPGRPNRRTIIGREFAQGILESEEYQQSLKRRIENGTLSPLVEILLYHYAYGKPKETVEIRRGPIDLSGLSTDELAQRAHSLAKQILERESHEQEHLTNERTIEAVALRTDVDVPSVK